MQEWLLVFKTFEQAECEHYTIEIDIDNFVLRSPAVLDKSNENKSNSDQNWRLRVNKMIKWLQSLKKHTKNFSLKDFLKDIKPKVI